MRRNILQFLLLFACAIVPGSTSNAQSFGSIQKFGVGTTPTKIVAADFNNDGIPDLATLDSAGNSISILLGHGDGTFATAQHFAIDVAATDFAAGDFSRDGNMDLLVYRSSYATDKTTANADALFVFTGRGDGTFKLPPGSCPCVGNFGAVGPLVLGDFDGNGTIDFAHAVYAAGPDNQISSTIRLFFGGANASDFSIQGNVGSASSQNGTGTTITDPVIGDFNDDGHPDLAYIAVGLEPQPNAQIVFLLNQANSIMAPTYTPKVFDTIQLPVNRITAADLSGDGKTDLILTYSGCLATCQGFTVYTNKGAGQFQRGSNVSIDPSTYANPTATIVADFNGDQHKDVAFLTRKSAGNPAQATDVVVIFAQNADGSFHAPTEAALDQPGENIAPTNLVFGDWNRDGLEDLAVASFTESNAAVLLNTPPPPPAPDFGLSFSTSTVSANSGSSANLNVNVSAFNGFSGSVTLSCSGLPSHAACTFTPAQLTPSATPATAVLTILTNAVTASLFHASPQFLFATSIPVLGFLFLGSSVLRRPRATRLLALLALALTLVAPGCGGTGGSPANPAPPPTPPSNPAPVGTPAGSYTITVTGTSGSTTHSAALTLNVQ